MKNLFTFLICILTSLLIGVDVTSAQNWEPTNGPFGGPVQCFTENSNYLFAGSTAGVYGKGIFRSADHGANWTTVNNGLNANNSGQDVSVMTTSGSNVVATTAAGVYFSSNNGDSWMQSSFPGEYYPYSYVHSGAALLSGGSSGLHISLDNGSSWTAQNDNFQGINAPSVPDIRSLASNDTILYAGTYHKGIFRSYDDGITWTTVNTGLGTTTQLNTRTFAPLVSSGNSMFAGTSGQGVYRLLNNGTSWTQEISGLPTGNARSVYSMIIKDSYIYICTGAGIYRSNNSGTISWSLQSITPSDLLINRLYLSGSDFFAATDKGVCKSSDNAFTWNLSNNGMQGLLITRVSSAGGTDLFASTLSGVMNGYYYKSSDFGQSWTQGTKTGIPFLFNNYLFIWQSSGIYRSADNGATWQFLNDFGTMCNFYSMGSTLFATITCCETIYYSNDNGDTWTPSTLLDLGGFWSNNILSMADDGTNLYAGTENSGVLKSTDNGVTWIACNSAMGNIPIRAMATKGSFVFAGTSNQYSNPNVTAIGIYRSPDYGATWQLINNGLGNLDICALLVNGSDIYAGTKAGVYKSTNNGDNWTLINQGFIIPPVATTLLISGNYLFTNNYVTTQGDPVYRMALTGSAPTLPAAISGNAAPCIGSSQTYSVASVTGVTYSWQFPSGWVITSGATTNSVSVTVGSTMGVILVTPSNGWGTGPAQYMIVTPNNNPPAQPAAISGLTNPDEGSSQVYSVLNDPTATYTWTFPAGWIQTAGGNSNSVTVTVGNTSGIITVTPSSFCGNGVSRTMEVAPVILSANKTLHINLFIEGLYNGTGMMNEARDMDNTPKWGVGVADKISVELHDAANYGIIIYSDNDVSLSTEGIATVTLPGSNSGSYYLTIKNRNSLETVSALPISFAGNTINYSFTTNPAQAYGANLKAMSGGFYAIYGGDATQDGIVDGSDMAVIDNASTSLLSGYYPEDVNGDGIVDGSDMALIDNNSTAIVQVQHP